MIEIKSKPCKGTGNAKGFGCGKITMHRIYGLGKSCCYADWLFNSDAGKVKMAKAIIKVQKPRKQFEALKKETKERVGITTLLKSVKDTCHKYIRLRDKGKPCVSCGSPYHSEHQAGHFYKAELFSTIKFNELNINGQCVKCNIRKDGNESEYRVNLPGRIGERNFKEINYLASLDKKIKNFKWDREELKKIRSYYNQKIKEL